MFCSRLLGSICGNYSDFLARRVAVGYKAMLSAALHAKTLRLGDIKVSGDVNIATLGEVDTQVMFQGSHLLLDVWSYPLQVVLCLAGLLYLLSWQGMLIVLVIALSMYPILGFIIGIMTTWIIKGMAAKDKRIKFTGEVLGSIQSIKMHAWESAFTNNLAEKRSVELNALQSMAISNAWLVSLMQTTPSLLTIAAFGVILWKGQVMDNQLIFASIMLFTMFSSSLTQMSTLATTIQVMKTSLDRIRNYMNLRETNLAPLGEPRNSNQGQGESIEIENIKLQWPGGARILESGTLDIKKRSLAVITGATGSGKSTTLLSLLRYMELNQSRTENLQVAYLPQQPFLTSGTVRDNILFGKDYDPELYERVVEACCLRPDFQRLRQADLTPIAGSIALSGGQKTRICLARAAYSQADVYILDDPLAAVDVKVQRHIIQRLLGSEGLLANTTRIISSSTPMLSREADSAYVLDKETLQRRTLSDAPLVEESSIGMAISSSGSDTTEVGITESPSDQPVSPASSSPKAQSLMANKAKSNPEHTFSDNHLEQAVLDVPQTSTDSKFWKHPIWTYVFAADRFGWPITIFLLLSGRLVSIFGTYVLKMMSSEPTPSRLRWDLVLFALFSMAQMLLFFMFIVSLYRFCVIPASTKIHTGLVKGVLSRRMDFFSVVPTGEILNLFTNDIARIDGSLTGSLISLIAQFANLFLSCVVLIVSTPISLVFVVPLIFLCFHLQQFYLEKLRELRHMDVSSRAPLLSYIQEANDGRVLFKVHNSVSLRLAKFQEMLQTNLRALFPLACMDVWIAVRLQILSVTLQALAVGALLASSVDLSTLGFVMTYVFQVTTILGNIARISALFEADSVSITRIKEYAILGSQDTEEFEPEERYRDEVGDGEGLSGKWPTDGKIEFRSVSARYRPGLPLSLNSLNVTISPGERVAVVGRTGAGKSSMILCLLGMMDQVGGEMLVDGVDIATVPSSKLLHSLSIIPQSPVIFSGSVHGNLDPLGLYTDEEIIQALKRSTAMQALEKLSDRKRDTISDPTKILDIDLDPGSSLSSGEIQLLALARTMLQESKILILDEATSSLDHETENLIHETIFGQFKNTIVAVMHRLELTMKYDKVMVMNNGKVVEYDSPAALIARDDGFYSSMLAEAGLLDDARCKLSKST
ncbi:P-loop containing nucleoside triphosphate hydrolase protein [Ilyonectria sp. MPI-CAGE-AT-0026]|nr:P-loop containing nucleoside triphosphate hydrolase protein [Ilyonectria sp. MPI-CAGE-AT-0026]